LLGRRVETWRVDPRRTAVRNEVALGWPFDAHLTKPITMQAIQPALMPMARNAGRRLP
jgi:hypothetical protein